MDGKVSVIGGDIYYSPNCSRALELPDPNETCEELFRTGQSTASEFQHPRWWTPTTEWLAFVPRLPVIYSGVLFEELAYIPRRINASNGGYCIQGQLSAKWYSLDQLLLQITKLLGEKYNLSYQRPFSPSYHKYHRQHETEEIALLSVTRGRDWFSLWIGLLYWMIGRIPDPKFVEGFTPPLWFVHLAVHLAASHRLNQALLDGFRTTPLLHRGWNIDRVGILLRFPGDFPPQSSAAWFTSNGVPIWYRWGSREAHASSRNAGFCLPAPSPWQLQNATSWLSSEPRLVGVPSLPSEEYHISNTHFEDESFAMPDTLPIDNVPSHNQSLPIFNANSADEPPPPPIDGHPLINQSETVKSGKPVWEPFFEKRDIMNTKTKARETTEARQRRENRERQPPTRTAPVYVWDWDTDNPKMFTRTLIRRDERVSTLEQYGEQQKRYDSFFNEWNCCLEWGPGLEWGADLEEVPDFGVRGEPPLEDEAELRTPPVALERNFLNKTREEPDALYTISPPLATAHPSSNPAFVSERFSREALDLLTTIYGFVPPIPIPQTINGDIGLADRRSFLGVLGISWVKPESLFFEQPVGKLCINFLKNFSSKSAAKPPSDDWDLDPLNHQAVTYSRRLRYIRIVGNSKGKMYMFDFGDISTVPWKLAVSSASTALYICRLDDKMTETDIAFDLVQSGVPFRTLQNISTLRLAPISNSFPTTPIRTQHEFTSTDYEFYRKQCQVLLTQCRARAALLRGGFVWRVAIMTISIQEALRGPTGLHAHPLHVFSVHDEDGHEYVDDELSTEELNLLCGLYISFSGEDSQQAKLSWFPLVGTYEGSGEDNGRWTDRIDSLYVERVGSILDQESPVKLRSPLPAHRWRDKLRGFADGRRARKQLELWSEEVIYRYGGTPSQSR